MHVIVTGGTGFIGRALVDRLLRDGYEVYVLTRSATKAQRNLPLLAKPLTWDGLTPGDWAEKVEGAEAVFNLAGSTVAVRWTPAAKDEIRNSRIEATRAIVEAIQGASTPPKSLIQASGVNYYGFHGNKKLTEADPPGSDFLAKLCIEWEGTAKLAEPKGVRICFMRLGPALEKDGGVLGKMWLPFWLFVGGPFGKGDQGFSWVHRDDVIGAMNFVMQRDDAAGPFNVTAPNPLSQREFCRILGRVMKRPSALSVPAPLLKRFFGEMASILLEGQFVLPQRLLEMGFTFQYPTAESALREILET